MQPTIRDVARHAGVSIATVSRVMHDHEHVSDPTRARVAESISALRFTPSTLGRHLAQRRHAANGIVFPDLSGPYYAEVVLGYESVAAELGRSVLILSTHGRDAAPAMVEEMASRCDGLVLMGRTVPDDVVRVIADRGLPLVLLARQWGADLDTVRAENAGSAAALARHLTDGGARRLVFAGDPQASPDVAERWTGIRAAIAGPTGAAGTGAEIEMVVPHGFSEAAGADLIRGFGPLPDAIVCANDELALGMLGQLRERGVDVPGTVQVTGWDDVMAARYAGLTTVRQPMRELGATAARLLDELINGERREPRQVVLPTELVIRTSTRAGRPDRTSERNRR